ncbi:MAG: metallophosphoesterase [Clostridia bacterium]|nr:metallophosphoesterase [Clostridia bacterium]
MKKKLIIAASAVALVAVLAAVMFIPFFEVKAEEPFVIACFSDPHHDYGIQNSAPYTRPSSQKAVEYVNKVTGGGADLVLVGGDISGRFSDWTDESIKNMMDGSFDLFKSASKDGDILWVTGNHDPEPSVYIDTMEINSNDYSTYLENAMGKPNAPLYSADIGEEHTFPFDELLCYRYSVNGFEFLCLNSPQADRRNTKQVGVNGLFIEQVEWVEEQLKSIGKDKTVFLLCHYAIDNINTVTSAFDLADTEVYNESRVKMAELMNEYNNVIYCYGHVHTELHEALADSKESVQQIDPENDSAIQCHMGSLGYCKDSYNDGNLSAEDPKVVQVMLIYVYSDRIVFAEHNTGEKPTFGGEYELAPYEISRDLSAQLCKKVSLFEKFFG